jgi:hypothetical protein
MAILSEPREVIDEHLRKLPEYRHEEELFPLAQLVQIKGYPDRRFLRPFLAESVSLVDFLVQERGAQTFTHFLRDGARDGYETALQRTYGWNFRQLEQQWQRHAFRERTPATPVAAVRRR